MTTTTREVERKYALPAGGDLPDLGGVSGVEAVSDPETFTQKAVYYDTADLRLARGGMTLRRRTGGKDDGWHLKIPADDGRDEIAAPLTSAKGGPPAEFAALVRASTRDAALVPIGRITTMRTLRVLTGPGGVRLAEVVTDKVSARTLDDASAMTRWTEVEVELVDGDPALLDAVSDALREAGIEPADSPSKLRQLLGDRVPPRPAAPSEESSAGEVVVAYLREQYDTLVTFDPRVRRDEPDAVHKMRVAARRARSTAQAFGSLFAEPLDEVIAELRWLGAELGAVRDLDVLPVTLGALLDPLPDELIVGPVRARMTAQHTSERQEAHEELLAALDSERYLALLARLEELVTQPEFAPSGSVQKLVRKTFRRLDRRVESALDLPPGAERDEAIHEARKSAKRARYAGEAATPALGKPAAKFASAMKELQEHLGIHQDSVFARTILRAMGMQAHLAGENAFTYGLLHGRAAAEAADVERKMPKRWRKAARRRLR